MCKMKKMLGFLSCIIIVSMIVGCSDKKQATKETDTQTKSESGSKNKDQVEDLSKEPIVGEWTLNSFVVEGEESSIAEWLEVGEVSDVDVYNFKPNGDIETTDTRYALKGMKWDKEEDKYYLLSEPKLELFYANEQLSFEKDSIEFKFIRGAKTSEEILKDSGRWHEDELQIVNYSVNALTPGYFEIVYEIKNNTDSNITFMGISMRETDANNTILKEYYSYNKHAVEIELQPQQSLNLDMTFSSDAGVSSIENSNYEYKTPEGQLIEGKFSSPYVIQL